MYLCYLDESGDLGVSAGSATPTYTVAAVFVHETQWLGLFEDLLRFRRYLRQNFNLRMRQEVKANQLVQGTGPWLNLGHGDKVRKRIYRSFMRLQDKTGVVQTFAVVVGPEGGARRPAAAGEEGGFGFPERRRGRLAVQVLRGDRAPVGAGAELRKDDGDDAVHPADKDRLGWQGELVELHPHRGSLLPVWTFTVPVAPGVNGGEAALSPDGVPLDRHSHQAQRDIGVHGICAARGQIPTRA
jgi:hypothetical protein